MDISQVGFWMQQAKTNEQSVAAHFLAILRQEGSERQRKLSAFLKEAHTTYNLTAPLGMGVSSAVFQTKQGSVVRLSENQAKAAIGFYAWAKQISNPYVPAIYSIAYSPDKQYVAVEMERLYELTETANVGYVNTNRQRVYHHGDHPETMWAKLKCKRWTSFRKISDVNSALFCVLWAQRNGKEAERHLERICELLTQMLAGDTSVLLTGRLTDSVIVNYRQIARFLLKKAQGQSIQLDLHRNNFMLRHSGEMVIIDPYWVEN